MNQFQSSIDLERIEEFKKPRILYIINNSLTPKPNAMLVKQYSNDTSEENEDIELLIKSLINKKGIEESKFFEEVNEIKRMRDSIESPMFGSSKVDSYQSQRNIIRGLTITSKDELEQAVPKKPTGLLFQKQPRHFSFNESEQSSFPSSYTSIKRQESLNSKETSNSNKTSNFKPLNQRISGSSGNASQKVQPSMFKNHLKSIASLVGADQNSIALSKSSSFSRLANQREVDSNIMRKRNTFTVTQIEVVHTEERKSNSTSESKERTDCEPPSMKMIGVVESKHTKSSNSKEENYFEIKVTPEEPKQVQAERKSSAIIERSTPTKGLIPPPRKEQRRLSENPRNINLLHDVPRQNNRIYKKKKSSRSVRSNSRALISKIMSQL